MKSKPRWHNDKTVLIHFDTKSAATHFLEWLCGSGEQQYWEWMECREDDESGNITVLDFDYNFKDLEVKTKLGRLTEDL